jgi:hypothetical protein
LTGSKPDNGIGQPERGRLRCFVIFAWKIVVLNVFSKIVRYNEMQNCKNYLATYFEFWRNYYSRMFSIIV